LDRDLVEFATSVPTRLKFMGRPKSLMIRALGTRLPAEVVDRPKQGFFLPFDQWLRSDFRREAEDILLAPCRSGILNRGGLANLWSRFIAGRLHWSRIWAVLILRLWSEMMSYSHWSC